MPGIFDAVMDPQFRADVRQGLLDAANRGVVGGLLGGPVDMMAMALRPFGYKVEKPVMGSEWIGQKMQDAGVVSANRNALAEMLAGVAIPAAANKLAPMVFAAEQAAIQNAAKPSTVNRAMRGQFGALKVADQPVYPQAEALETARKNAVKMLGLPENNTPMDRAMALGYIDAYHGTADDIAKIDPAKFGSSTGAQSAKKAFWAVDDPITARGYAEYAAKDAKVKKLIDAADKAEKRGNWGQYDDLVAKAESLESLYAQEPLQGQSVMPLMLRANKGVRGAEMDAKGAEFVDLEGGVNRFLTQAIRDGRDLGVIKNLSDDVALNGRPATHYAVLNPSVVRSRYAAFDPARVNDNDLLGRADPTLLGLLGLGAGGAAYLTRDKSGQ